MGGLAKAADVAERLRLLQSMRALTIQEMADLCGLPKRSLENYMNLKEPQRPGIDALIGVADGFGVSIDWIVGRAEASDIGEFAKEDFAVFCQSTVLHVLLKILEAVKVNPSSAIDAENGLIMGYELHDIASVAMLDFIEIVELQSGHATRPKDYFKRNFASLKRMAVEEAGIGSIADLKERKP